MIRRALLALIALAVLPLASPAFAQAPGVQPGDRTLGRANASVTVVEYASITCGHCARWHAEVWPEFKRRFVDTGRVRFVFREMPTAPAPVAIGGFVMARCLPESRYFDVIDDLMDEQAQVVASPLVRLRAIAARYGMTEAQFDACIDDDEAIDALRARVDAAVAVGVRSTPTFYVNGRQVASGEAPLATLEAAIIAAER